MSTPPISDDLALEAVAAMETHLTQIAAADALKISRAGLQGRLHAAAQRGFMGTAPVLPGYEIKKTSRQTGPDGELQREWVQQSKAPGEEFVTPEGHEIKGVSALLNADGRITAQWVKTKIGSLTVEALIERVKAAMEGYKPAAAVSAAPAVSDAKLLTLIPCNDWHVGLSAWGKQVGIDWDLKIAERVIGAAIENNIARSLASGHAIVLGGGDLIHADNKHNQTTSGTPQDVDGRYQKVIDVACRLMARTVDAALRRHKHVTVRILQGNHDEHACIAVAYFLLAWYRKDKRVTVDVDPSLFFERRFGLVMLGATHGHLAKLKDLPGIMAHRWAEDWGATRFRYGHGFHVHHKEKLVTEGNGCVCETHQAPIPQDSWHYGKGFLSGRSVQSITYHRDVGEYDRVNTMIMDAS